jgi:hypothetical protein
MSWYKTYAIKKNNIDVEKYINLVNINKCEDTIEKKITELESNYKKKLQELNEISIDTTIYENKNSLLILQQEVEVIKLLTQYSLENNQLDYLFFLKTLKYLFGLSEILSLRLNQKIITHEVNITPTNLPRCSYKFCNFKENCSFNYNSNSKNSCYQHHYVHNMVSGDLQVLILYIEKKFQDSNFVIHNKEILKTINTLSYVISHMENELKTRCLHLPESEIEKNHYIKAHV